MQANTAEIQWTMDGLFELGVVRQCSSLILATEPQATSGNRVPECVYLDTVEKVGSGWLLVFSFFAIA
jgi:hypothetical protein